MSVTQCTWKDPETPRCSETAKHPQVADDGSQWANLCDEHNSKLDGALGVNVKNTLAYWVRAQGGARAAADRMTGGRR